MEKTYYDLIYLATCGVNQIAVDKSVLGEVDLEQLYKVSRTHYLEALVGTTLKKSGISIPKEWDEQIAKAIRKVLLFDAERAKILSFMENNGIWHLPLKGVILKDYYPGIGMRQMADNDILFDYKYWKEVKAYMKSEGYSAESVGHSNHDVYQKEPVYNFELHSDLYSEFFQKGWKEYYHNIKDRLILDAGSSYGYHFTDEDFYVYLIAHAYKHHVQGGTGLRSLLDFYVYLKAKPELDFAYITKECEFLGVAEYERQNRILCEKIFDVYVQNGADTLEQNLTSEESELLLYCLTSGVHGTFTRIVEHRMEEYWEDNGNRSKLRYVWHRFIPSMETMKRHYPFFYKHKILLPIGWVYRLLWPVFDKKRRNAVLGEISTIKKMK